MEVRLELLWPIPEPFRAMFGVPHPLKVGGLRPPTFPGTSGMGLRICFLFLTLISGNFGGPFGLIMADFGLSRRHYRTQRVQLRM